jgi:hypothetical protein
MTLTIFQLQQMYGTSNVQQLRGANPNAAPKNAGDMGVLERSAANSPIEIIPDDDNPLFMNVEQRALAHQIKRDQEMQDMKRQSAEVKESSEAMRREHAIFETLSPEEQRLYLDQRKQKELDAYNAYQAKEVVRLEKLKASLPPRISGALGEDLRLSNQDLEEANFLEAMKVKYAHLKDVYAPPAPELDALPALFPMPSKESPTYKNNPESFDRIRTQDIERRQEVNRLNEEKVQAWQKDIDRAGNTFVMVLNYAFSHSVSILSSIDSNAKGVKNATQDLESGNTRPFLREQIAQQQANVDKGWQDIRNHLEYVKRMIDDNGFAMEASQYFADYTQFHIGTAYNLNAVYREAGIA